MTTIAQGIIEFGGDASGVTAAAAEVSKSIDSIGSKVKQLGNESGDGFKKVEDGAKSAAKATQTWNDYLKENIAEARKQFASQDLSKAESYSAALKKVSEQWKEMQKARQSASTPISLGAGDVDALTKAQDRLLNSIARQATVVTEGKAKWLELRAAQAGISEQATPYIAKLKSIEKSTSDLGISQGQLSAAMRGVPAQFTDIITSLQGGQQPLTVFLQQGGQLKDMFGGAGNAARALGGYVLGLVNPLTIAAGAAGVLAVAYNQGSNEAQKFANALITTGNAAGTTKNELMDMARTISQSGMSTQGVAAEALSALVSTGKVGVDNLQKFASVAVQAQKVIGASIQDTAKDFAELGKSPLQASIKLDEQYNFLTVSIYKQIKALQDQGKTTEAATLAQNTYADSLASRTAGIEQNLGSIERGWNGVKNFAKSAWDEMLGIGRETTDSERIAQLQTNIKNRLDFIARERPQSLLIPKAQSQNLVDQQELDLLLKKTKEQKTQADLKAKENAAKNAGLEFDRQGDEFLDKKTKLTKELAKATQTYLDSLAGDKRSKEEKEKDIELITRLTKIREKYKDSVSKEETAYQSLSRSISEKVALSQVELNSEKPLSEAQKLRVKLMELVAESHGKITKAQEIELKNKIDLIRSNELAKSSYEGLRKELEKFKPSVTADDLVASIVKQDKAYSDIVVTQAQYRQSLQDTADLMQLEASLAGQSAIDRNTAIEQYKIEIALQKELLKIKEDINLSDARKKELSSVATENANIAKSQAALKVQQGEWAKFYDDIYNGLTDSLYRGFEAGKGFFKSFWDGIKNLFKTTVLKLAVQGVVTGTLGSIGIGSANAAQANPLGNTVSLINAGKTLFQGFSAAGSALNTSLATSIGELGATMGSEFMLSVSSMMQGGAASGAAGTVAGGLTSAATMMPYVAAAVAAFQGMKAINSGYRLGGLSADAGAALFGISPRLFGRKAPELQQSEFSGSVGAGGFDAMTRDVYKAKGGVFRSDKWSEVKTPLADTSGLTKQYEAIKSVAASYADLLGLSTESLASFSKSFTFNLSKTGDAAKDAEANQKLINDLFVGITNDITNLLAPSISAFSKEGESTSQTLQRLATSLTDVNSVVKSIGFAGFAKSLEGASAAQKLVDVTGGIEKLASGTQFFFENFLNDAEKIKPSIDQVAATMARLGQSAVDTIPEFKQLVQGLDLTSEAEAKMYAELIAIAPQFKAVADYASQATGAIQDNAAALKTAKEIENERKSLQDEYNQLTMTSTQLYAIYRSGLDESNRALADSIQAVKEKAIADEKAAQAMAEQQRQAAEIASERNTLQNEYNQLTMSSADLLQLQRAGLDESNRALFDTIQATKEKIDTEKQFANIQKAIDDERNSLMSEYNDLTMTSEQRLQAQRFALDQSNVGLYDQIMALKEKNKADQEAAAIEKAVADQRKTLQDEYNALTMTETQLLDLRRSTYDASNRDLFDAIQAEKVAKNKALEDQKEYNDKIAEQQRQSQAIASERSTLQDEYNSLTLTEIQLMDLKRQSLNENNRDLFDLINAEKLRQAALVETQKQAAEAQTILANKAAEIAAQRNSLQDEYNQLTLSNVQLLDIQRSGLDESNRALFDSIQAVKSKQAADELAAQQAAAVAQERLGLQNQLNALTDTSAQALERQRSALDESNKGIFDQIQAINAQKSAEQEAAAAAAAAAQQAATIAQQRTGLQDQLNALTDTAAQALARQRAELDESNRSIFDQIEAVKAQRQAEEIAAQKAAAISQQRIELQDQLNGLTDTSSQALARQRDLLDESNRALFDQIQAITAQKAAEQEAAQQAAIIAQERIGLQSELNTLTDTAAQSIARQRDSLSESNRALFDSIQAIKDRQAAEQLAAQQAATIAQQRAGLQDQLNNLTETAAQSLFRQRNALDESNRALFDQVNAIESQRKAAEAAAQQSAAIAQERNGLQDEFNRLTMTNAELLSLQRNGLSESNRALFDQIQAVKDRQAAEQAAAAAATNIAQEREGLQSQLNSLTDTAVQALARQRDALDESNRAIFDQVQAVTAQKAAEQAAAQQSAEIAQQRISLQDQLNSLTDTAAQSLERQRNAIDESNRALFDQVQAINAQKEAAAAAAQQSAEIEQQRVGLQNELNSLTDTAAQALQRQRDALFDSNKALFDQIQSINAQKQAAQEAAAAAEIAAVKANSIAQERLGLQDQLNSLTDTAAQALQRQRDALDESNRSLFDQVQAVTAQKKAEQAAAQQAIEINQQRISLQDQLNALTETAAESLIRQRDALDESNRSLFDQIQAVKERDQAEKIAAARADSIAQERVGLQSQINQLTDTAAQSLARQRDALDESNRALFDQIQSINAQKEAAAAAAAKLAEIAQQRIGLQDQLNALTETNAESLARQREALDESNRSLFDQIQAITAQKEAAAAAAQQAANIAQERLGLQDQINQLTDTNAQALARQRDSLDESNKGLFDQIQAIKDRQEAELLATQKAAAIAQERLGLQDQLNGLTDTNAQSIARQRNALDESNRAIFDQIQAILAQKESFEASRKAIDDAMNGVRQSIDLEKSRIEIIKDAAKESVNSIKGVFTLLDNQISDIYGTVNSTKAASSTIGNSFIDNALFNAKTSGYLPDQDKLAEAIASARSGLTSDQFATQFEADKAALIMAGKLSQLKDLAAPQLSIAELALKAAEDQIVALNDQLMLAQKQIDAINGVNTSVLSVGEAIAVFTDAISKSTIIAPANSASSMGDISAVPQSVYDASTPAANEVKMELLIEEIQRLQNLTIITNENTRRTATAVNGNPEVPMLVQVVTE